MQFHHLGKALTNLWNLMDTPYEDRQLFSHVTVLLSVSSAEVSDPGSLTHSIILQVINVHDNFKSNRTKEITIL